MAIVKLAQETIKLIEAFAARAGLDDTEEGLNVALSLGDALVRDAQAGAQYSVLPGGSRLNLSEIFESHLDLAEKARQSAQVYESHEVDDAAVARINVYLSHESMPAPDTNNLVSATVSLAKAFYDQFGREQEGVLHIPVYDPLQKPHDYIDLKL